ncbi:TspO/MBR family protein [Flavobacterium coralii]|uniref:TspO/MBR family protein n=1 Tax=Flavobacterium coralii TaxID=2838017 RepID=UPI000C395F61|nr:sensory protein TspO [Flavobacterium sp.]|tara:strand:- start:610 stop:1086 length:477 start_codon:yes stop_codon:yes gene_type:complete
MPRILKILIMVVTCVAVGYLSGEVTREGVTTWYPTLEKPVFNPPNWVFAPVWTILYILMGVAAGLVWQRTDEQKETVKKGLTFFGIQLVLNALWSYLFFGLNNPMLALIEIILLLLMIYETYIQFKKVNTLAAWLLMPYLAWVAFATVLNASIWWLNR